MNLQFSPLYLSADSDGYCGTPVPHWPFPQIGPVNPGVFFQPGVQQGLVVGR